MLLPWTGIASLQQTAAIPQSRAIETKLHIVGILTSWFLGGSANAKKSEPVGICGEADHTVVHPIPFMPGWGKV